MRNLHTKLFRKQNGLCYYCHLPMNWQENSSKRVTIEHLKPRVKCGTNDPVNLVAACCACNGKMNRKMQIQDNQVNHNFKGTYRASTLH